MATHRRVGILTGGGDVPGLNVALKAVVTRAQGRDVDVLGLRRGWRSVLEIDPSDPATLEEWTTLLTQERVRTIDRTGGTILHTSRVNPVNVPVDEVPACVRARIA
jgi:6-phosphofructokinase 1